MPAKYDKTIAAEIINRYGARPEMLVQILHAFVERYSCISDEAIRQIALALNLSRAEVHGVVSFYHDFRTTPAGKRVIRICQAESCQAMGSRKLTEHAEEKTGLSLNETSSDGELTLEAVYCLGNCACSPAVMDGEKVYGRVDPEAFDRILGRKQA
ncbi:MAG TPA: NAD(P)H-dependent oxidoreductase subunit E [Woeseiaceae bacterium]|nr:NAD(P)H-dependent oxidoreductase subunit E [Woeseiaceae bacterium]